MRDQEIIRIQIQRELETVANLQKEINTRLGMIQGMRFTLGEIGDEAASENAAPFPDNSGVG